MSKSDTRIEKTEDRLQKSLLKLLKEKRLDKITVTEICADSKVNRNTFYSHYSSLEDLLEHIEGTLFEKVFERLKINQDSVNSVTDMVTDLMEIIKENGEITSILFSKNGDKEFIQRALMFAMPVASRNWLDNLDISEDDARRLYLYVIGGISSLLDDWINRGFYCPPSELAELMNKFIIDGQNAFSKKEES